MVESNTFAFLFFYSLIIILTQTCEESMTTTSKIETREKGRNPTPIQNCKTNTTICKSIAPKTRDLDNSLFNHWHHEEE